jgi:hypothetical protein
MLKKNPILKNALMLVLASGLLIAFSFSTLNFNIFGTELKKPAIKEFLTYEPPKPVQKIIKTNVLATSKTPARKIDTSSQRILMVGESMIEGLMFPFIKYAHYNHHNLQAKIWYGSTTIAWSQNDTLKKIIEKAKPTFIIVSIASNELYAKNISVREPYVKKILKQLDGYNYVWIGPPNPSTDYGINDIIERNTGQDRFFMSKYMSFDRIQDGVHPTRESSRKWADSIAVWIMEKSRHPIMLKRPEEGTAPISTTKHGSKERKNKEATRQKPGKEGLKSKAA